MKNIKLRSIELNNFKGIKHFFCEFDSIESVIAAKNGGGKSSIEDAISWVLEGKNAAGKADFNIKTLDKENNVIPDLKHSCELVFDIDGTERKLKRTYYEKIQKVTGLGKDSARSTGHTTDFEVDGISKNKGTFEKAVAEIMTVPKEEFMMLSNPLYFISRMHWEKKRKVLCDIAGDITYNDVLVEPMFKPLNIDLDKHKPEEYKTHCNSQSLKITGQLKEIKVQINENDLAKKKVSQIDFEDIEREIKEGEAFVKEHNEKLLSLTDSTAKEEINLEYSSRINKANQQREDLEKQKFDKVSERQKLIDIESSTHQKTIDEKNEILDIEKAKCKNLKDQHDGIDERLAKAGKDLEEMNSYIESIRESSKLIRERVFEFIPTDTCASCLRDFTDEDNEMKESAALASFKEINKREIDANNEKGKGAKVRIEKIEGDIKILENQKASVWVEIINQKKVVETLIEEIKNLNAEKSKIDTEEKDREIAELTTAISLVNSRLSDLSKEKELKIASLDDDDTNNLKIEIENQINNTSKSISEKRETLALKGTLKEKDERIAELKKQEKEVSKSAEMWDEQKFLTQKLMDAYASKVQDSVNGMFSFVKFKLFKHLQNRGTESICEVLLDGVPDNDINTAGLTNAGIDVINTLSNYYGIRVPIVIDNRESITHITPTESQVINLYKNRDVKTLTYFGVSGEEYEKSLMKK